MKSGNAYIPHDRVTSDPSGKSRTKQAFREETDINHILRKAEKGLLLEHVNQHQGQYGDFIDALDYHTALNRISEAKTAFMTIPADVRANFDNDPQKFLAYAQDPDNIEGMREMGLAPDDPNPPEATANVPTPPEAPGMSPTTPGASPTPEVPPAAGAPS